MNKTPLILLTGLLLSLTACGTLDVASFWAGSAITIDGRTDDWRDRLFDIKDTGLSFGVQNDDRFIYVCVRSADRRAAAQILRAGLIVWFDPKGGKDKILGIHYPLETDLSDFPVLAGRTGGQLDPAAQRERRQAMAEVRNEIEILGPGRDEKIRLKKDELKGLEAAFANTAGMFVYELKVPLAAGLESPYTVGLKSGNLIGIGFDSPRPEMLMGRPGAGGRIPGGGGMGPGMGGHRGGRGRGGRMGGGMMGGRGGRGGAEPLKMWLKVSLAGSPEKKTS